MAIAIKGIVDQNGVEHRFDHEYLANNPDIDEIRGELKNEIDILNSLRKNGTYEIRQSDLVSGAWSYTTPSTNANRLRSKYMIPVKKGTTFYYDTETDQEVYFGVAESETSGSTNFITSGWVSGNGSWTTVADGYMTFNVKKTSNGTISVSDYNSTAIIDESLQNATAYKKGKYVAFGDSISWGSVWSPTEGTAYHRVKESWRIPARIALATGYYTNYVNESIGGIGYLRALDGENLVEMIAEYDFTGVDFVTIQAGANDKLYFDLGTSDDADSETVCGAIRNIIQTIFTSNPKTQIVIIQPTPTAVNGAIGDVWHDGAKWSLVEFDREVSKLCKKEHIGYVNWWESAYIRNWQNVGYNESTGPNYTHPTVDYDYCIMGDFIAGKIAALGKQEGESIECGQSLDAVLSGNDVMLTWKKNVGINSETGADITSTGYSTTDYIMIPDGATAVINTYAAVLRYAIYDQSGNTIDVYNNGFGINIRISSEDAYYCRLMFPSITDSDLEKVSVNFEYADGIARESGVAKRVLNTNVFGFSNEKATVTGNPIVVSDATSDVISDISVSDGTSGEVLSLCGKNLFHFQHKSRLGLSSNGVTFTFNMKTQEYTVKSTTGATATAISANDTCTGCTTLDGVTAYHNFHFRMKTDTPVTITPYYSYEPHYDDKIRLDLLWTEGGNIKALPIGHEGATIIASAGVEYGIRLRVAAGWTGEITMKPQVEIGRQSTVLEQYLGADVTLPLTDGSNLFNMPAVGRRLYAPVSGISAYFDYLEYTVTVESASPASNGIICNPSYDGKVNNADWLYLAKFTPGAVPVYVPGVPEELVGMIAIAVSDGTNFVVYNTTTAPAVFVGESGKEYGYRIHVNAGAAFTYRFSPVIATGKRLLKEFGTYYPTMTAYTDGSASISVQYGKAKLSDEILSAVEIAKGVDKLTGGRIFSALDKLSDAGPVICFIDDDTSNATYVQQYHDIFAAEGVVGNYAVEMENLDNNPGLDDVLLEYERRGFGMIYHCYAQHGDSTRYWESGNAAYDEDLIRTNFYRGLRKYKKVGFNSAKYWVTPYGVNDQFIQNLAKEADMECLLTCPTSTYTSNAIITLGSNVKRYNMPRCIFLSDTNNDWQIKMLIDGCAADKGMLVIVTHVNSWPSAMVEANTARLTGLIQYAKAAGCKIQNFMTAYQTFKPLLMLNELF